ncbi:SDR family oxidoreductase [Nocardia sp. NBC_01377]|uniref:SDR family NAD(P)-dependent oxidoreductase n=1 Tax=Nocardia sp. NBC_01377 TaxID=2903595 RepID=UPI00324D035E
MTEDSAPVAVVSGTSSGIGAAVAEILLERGYSVLGLSRRGNPALSDRSGYVDSIADLRDPDSVHRAVEAVPELTTRSLRAVILNAGHSPDPAELTALPWDTAVHAFTANVATALSVVQGTGQWLKRSRGGSLVFVGASLANGYKPERFAYAASKAAMTTLMRACSVEFAEDGVVSNEVRPGPVATPMTMAGLDDGITDDVLQVINQGFGTDWLKSSRTVAEWIVTIAEFPSNGPTGQIFNYSRKTL